MTLADRLMDVYNRMFECYGPRHWWPGDTWFEIMVGAVLTQSAAWTNVEKAIANLKDAGLLTPEGIWVADEARLAELVYPSGYFNMKAKKLKALAEYLGRRFDDDVDAMMAEETEPLREELLGVYGIGEETADDILLYALEKPTFVVDAYTRRIFSRLGLAPERDTYVAYRALFQENLPRDTYLYNEYHALIVQHGKDVCKKRPACPGCCLLELCPTGRSLGLAGEQ